MADDLWAEFRQSSSAPASTAPTAADPWAEFREAAQAPPTAPSAPKMDAAGDIGGGIVTGLANAVTGFAGLPGLLQQAEGYLGGKALDAMGFPNAAETVRGLPFLPTPETLTGRVEMVTGTLYKPQTTLGQYARTIGEFAPGALIGPGGVVRKVAETVVPAVASETAGQVTKGGAAEPYARLMGAILGNVGTAAVAARTTGSERAIIGATRGQTPDELRAGQPVLDTGYGIGVPLSGPEGIQQATRNGTKLGDLQRVVEGSTDGGPTMARFYADRPVQVRNATNRTLDTISPAAPDPYALGPRAADTAHGAMMATTEGQALQEAIWRVGPRETAGSVGPRIQDGLADTYARREGMRAAAADYDYAAARNAEPQIDVSSLEPRAFQAAPRTTYRYAGDEGGYAPVEQPRGAPRIETLSAPDATGMIQADPRNVAGFLDTELQSAKGATATALGSVRGMLASGDGLDTTVAGLSNVRSQVGTMLSAAVRDGDRPTAAALERVQAQLDQSLELVPEHATATRNFAAASEPLRPFENTALARIIDRDDYGRGFTLPPERAAPTLETAGPTTVRDFNGVAPYEARAGFENYLGTKIIDNATDGRGRLSGDRLALGARSAADILDEVPGLRERIIGVQTADAAMAPRRASPLGQVAEAPDTRAAADAILPAAPLNGGEDRLIDAVTRMGARDPEATAQLVRQRLADQADTSRRDLQGGEAQYGGANFARDIAGTDQKRRNLGAVLRALPNSPEAPAAVDALMEVLRATGKRKPPGSNTAADRETQKALSDPGLFGQGVSAARTAGVSLVQNAAENARRVALGRRMDYLARVFTAPDSADQIADVVARGVEPVLANAARRQALQTPSIAAAFGASPLSQGSAR